MYAASFVKERSADSFSSGACSKRNAPQAKRQAVNTNPNMS
jgi:hypothetical protein